MRRTNGLIVEEQHIFKPQTRQLLAPSGCQAGMGIETCQDCLLPDCNEDKGRHWLRDEGILADHKAGMCLRQLSEKWGLSGRDDKGEIIGV